MFDMCSRLTRIDQAIIIHNTLHKDATNVGERLRQNEAFSWEKGTRFSDTLLRKKRRQSESNRPLSDLSTDLLMVSRNQPGKRATCPFILFIENSSHMCYAVWMANFNFLAQPIIITIHFSLRFSRQNKSSSSTWCQSLLSLNRMIVRVNVNFERRGVVWIESWLWMICEEDVCWVVGIPQTYSFLACSCLVKVESLVYVVIRKKYWIINTTRLVTWFRLQAIRWFLGPQQRFNNKNGNQTTQNGVSPFPISLSLMASHFLSDQNTMLTLLTLFVNGLMWPFSMMVTFSHSEGIFTSTAVSENIHILWNRQ